MHRIHHDDETARSEQLVLDLDEIARRGAQQMLAQALEAEIEAYLLYWNRGCRGGYGACHA